MLANFRNRLLGNGSGFACAFAQDLFNPARVCLQFGSAVANRL
jgi:hypothetical protein